MLEGAPTRGGATRAFAAAPKGEDYLATGRGGRNGGAGGDGMRPLKLVVRLPVVRLPGLPPGVLRRGTAIQVRRQLPSPSRSGSASGAIQPRGRAR